MNGSFSWDEGTIRNAAGSIGGACFFLASMEVRGLYNVAGDIPEWCLNEVVVMTFPGAWIKWR